MSYLSDLLGTSYKEGMSEEDISKALEKAIKKNDSETDKLKAMLTKANSEAADYKKQLRDKQTDDEAAAAEQKAQFEKLMQENAELRKSMDMANKTAKLTAQGYDEELAKATAKAMIEGDFDTVLANQAKYLESQKTAIKQDLMNSTPKPSMGGGSQSPLDIDKKIDEARSEDNFAAIAYYTRLKQQETSEGDVN